MKYALISDIHANLPALEAVLGDIERRPDVNAVYHLGDLVGYGPWPNEVVGLLQSRGIPGIAGNYDSTTATDYEHCGCRYENPRQEELAHQSYTWSRAHVSPQTKRYLASLPFRVDLWPLGGHLSGTPRLILVHGSPTLNTLYWTEDRPESFCRQMAGIAGMRAGDTIAFGHTHRPYLREVGEMYFLNAGSVGKPKDGDWRACYVLVEAGGETPHVTFVRVEYDIERAMQAIRNSELPNEFAEDLRTGGSREPNVEYRTKDPETQPQ
jgi:predicted phosphodiesterase